MTKWTEIHKLYHLLGEGQRRVKEINNSAAWVNIVSLQNN